MIWRIGNLQPEKCWFRLIFLPHDSHFLDDFQGARAFLNSSAKGSTSNEKEKGVPGSHRILLISPKMNQEIFTEISKDFQRFGPTCRPSLNLLFHHSSDGLFTPGFFNSFSTSDFPQILDGVLGLRKKDVIPFKSWPVFQQSKFHLPSMAFFSPPWGMSKSFRIWPIKGFHQEGLFAFEKVLPKNISRSVRKMLRTNALIGLSNWSEIFRNAADPAYTHRKWYSKRIKTFFLTSLVIHLPSLGIFWLI